MMRLKLSLIFIVFFFSISFLILSVNATTTTNQYSQSQTINISGFNTSSPVNLNTQNSVTYNITENQSGTVASITRAQTAYDYNTGAGTTNTVYNGSSAFPPAWSFAGSALNSGLYSKIQTDDTTYLTSVDYGTNWEATFKFNITISENPNNIDWIWWHIVQESIHTPTGEDAACYIADFGAGAWGRICTMSADGTYASCDYNITTANVSQFVSNGQIVAACSGNNLDSAGDLGFDYVQAKVGYNSTSYSPVYRAEVEHNATGVTWSGNLNSINVSVNFTTNVTSTINMTIYNFKDNLWNYTICNNGTATTGTWYNWWCNATVDNPSYYNSSTGVIRIRLNGTSLNSQQATIMEDYVQYYVTNTTIQIFRPNISESLSLTTNSPEQLSLNRKLANGISLTGPNQRPLAIGRGIKDSVSLNPLLIKIATFSKPLNQFFTTTASLSQFSSKIREIGNSLNIGELMNRLISLKRSIMNSINLGNNLEKLTSFTRSLSNAVNMNGVGDRILTKLRQVMANFNTNVYTSRAITFVKYLSDSMNLGEITARMSSLVRLINGSFSMIEEALLPSLKGVTEIASKLSIQISEAANNINSFMRSLGSVFNLSDTANKIFSSIRNLGSGLNIGDVLSHTGAFVRSLSNSVNLNGIASTISSFMKSLANSMNLMDSLNKISSFNKNVIDPFLLTDYTQRINSFLKLIAQNFSLFERLNLLGKQMPERIVSLALSITGNMGRVMTNIRATINTINILDLYQRIISISRGIQNALSMNGIPARISILIRNLNESVNLSELFSRISMFQRFSSLEVIVNNFIFSGLKTVSSIFIVPASSVSQGEFVEFDINVQNTWTGELTVSTGVDVYNSTNDLVATVNSTNVSLSSNQYKYIVTFLNTQNMSAGTYRAEGVVLFDNRATVNMTKFFNITQAANVQIGNYTNTSVEIVADIPTLITANTSSTTTSNISVVLNSTQEGAIGVAEFSSVENQTISGYNKLGKFIDIRASPNITDNLRWYWLNISYTDSEVAASGITESNLRLFFYNRSTNAWQQEENSGVNTESNYVWANVSHFSLFGIYSQIVSQPAQIPTAGGSVISGGGITAIKTLPTVKVDFVKWDILREVTPGQSIVEGIVIKNKQNTSIEGLRVEVSGVPQSWVTVIPKILDLEGLGTKGFTIAISVPQDATYGDYIVSMKVYDDKISDENFFILRLVKHPTGVITPIVTRVVEIDKINGKANVNIDVTSSETKINSVEIIENVPKYLAQSADEIDFKTAPSKIVEKDPIIQWILLRLGYNETERISYSLKIPPEFKNLIYFPIKQINVVGQKIPSKLKLTENLLPVFSPGENSTFRFTIENLDSDSHTFGFELQLPDGWKSSPEILKEEIKPGGIKSFEVTISLPKDVNTGIYMLRTFYSWDDDTLIRENAVSVTSAIFRLWSTIIIIVTATTLVLGVIILILYKKKKEIIEPERFVAMIRLKLVIKKILRRMRKK